MSPLVVVDRLAVNSNINLNIYPSTCSRPSSSFTSRTAHASMGEMSLSTSIPNLSLPDNDNYLSLGRSTVHKMPSSSTIGIEDDEDAV